MGEEVWCDFVSLGNLVILVDYITTLSPQVYRAIALLFRSAFVIRNNLRQFRQFQDFDGKRDLAVALCVSHFHAEYVRGAADEFAGDRASQVMNSSISRSRLSEYHV